MILRCTRKLLVVIGSPVADPAPAHDPEDWYANLLWFDRRKCLLLTHAGDALQDLRADVTASSLRATRQLVTGLIGRELRREDLPAATFGDLEQQEVLLAKTAGMQQDLGHAAAQTLSIQRRATPQTRRGVIMCP